MLQYLKKNGFQAGAVIDPSLAKDLAASFQAAVVAVLVRKLEWAVREQGIRRITLSGGVAANSGLRRQVMQMGDEKGIRVYVPSVALCTDNAAMIAAAGYHHALKRDFAGSDLNPRAYMSLSAEEV